MRGDTSQSPIWGLCTTSIRRAVRGQWCATLRGDGQLPPHRIHLPRAPRCELLDQLGSCMKRVINQNLSGNEVHSTACSLLVISKNLCSKLHCEKGFELVLFSYKILTTCFPDFLCLPQVRRGQGTRGSALLGDMGRRRGRGVAPRPLTARRPLNTRTGRCSALISQKVFMTLF